MARFHTLTVSAVRADTRDAVVLTLQPAPQEAAAFAFEAGQHLNVRAVIGGTEQRRSYSVCSAPDEPLRIAVKRVPDGIFSTWATTVLRAGDTLEAMPPEGRFGHLPHDGAAPADAHYLGIAAGSGITPLVSVMRHRLLTEPVCRFTLLYGNRSSSSVMFREELADLKDRYPTRVNLVHVLSREQQDIELFDGRLDAARLHELLTRWVLGGPDAPADAGLLDGVFVCGPRGMMDAAAAVLRDLGLPAERLRMESFGEGLKPVARRVAQPQAAYASQCELTVVQDGRRSVHAIARDGSTLLDAALAAGIDLPWSCKAGVCSTCRCLLAEGEVDADDALALEDYELAQGFRLTCRSRPVSDRLVIDFDAR